MADDLSSALLDQPRKADPEDQGERLRVAVERLAQPINEAGVT